MGKTNRYSFEDEDMFEEEQNHKNFNRKINRKALRKNKERFIDSGFVRSDEVDLVK